MKELEEIISGIENVNELTFYNLPVLPVKQLLEEREELMKYLDKQWNGWRTIYNDFARGKLKTYEEIYEVVKKEVEGE